MADEQNTPRPMDDADIEAPPAETEFQPAAPLKDAGVEFDADDALSADTAPADAALADAAPVGTRQTVRDHAGKLGQQATDRVRQFAEDGKARAGGALDQLAQMLTDAAGQVDAKLGNQYGQYARQAADTVQGFSATVRDKDLDELMDDARGFVRQSPAVAIGAAAAIGFVLARLVQSGIDADRA